MTLFAWQNLLGTFVSWCVLLKFFSLITFRYDCNANNCYCYYNFGIKSQVWHQTSQSKLTLQTPKAIIMVHWIIRSWYTGHWWVRCYIWYIEEAPGQTAAPLSPLLVVPNVTAYPSMASVLITVLLYDGPLPCSLYVKLVIIFLSQNCRNTR